MTLAITKPTDILVTIRDYLRWATSEFSRNEIYYGHGTDNPWDEAIALVFPLLRLPMNLPTDVLDAKLTLEERDLIYSAIKRRVSERVPAAYITGISWFAGLEFIVDSSVLVPRSPIAELIDNHFEPWLADYPHRILDLCTGGGCIGIACASRFDDSEVVLSDISEAAIAVAQQNIEKHQMGDQVSAVCGDLFGGVDGQRFDLIVSNPPYVNDEDLSAMPAEYQAEPSIALGSGFDGLDFTRRLLVEAKDYLTDNGLLIVEVGNSWPALEQAFPDIPFTWVEFENGGHGVFILNRSQLID